MTSRYQFDSILNFLRSRLFIFLRHFLKSFQKCRVNFLSSWRVMYHILIVWVCVGVRRFYGFSECMSPQLLSMASLVKNDLSNSCHYRFFQLRSCPRDTTNRMKNAGLLRITRKSFQLRLIYGELVLADLAEERAIRAGCKMESTDRNHKRPRCACGQDFREKITVSNKVKQ